MMLITQHCSCLYWLPAIVGLNQATKYLKPEFYSMVWDRTLLPKSWDTLEFKFPHYLNQGQHRKRCPRTFNLLVESHKIGIFLGLCFHRYGEPERSATFHHYDLSWSTTEGSVSKLYLISRLDLPARMWGAHTQRESIMTWVEPKFLPLQAQGSTADFSRNPKLVMYSPCRPSLI